MANTLGITEVTLAELVDSTDTHNLYATRPQQLGSGGPLVVRVTYHADNDAGETGDDTDLMAIFQSRAFGEPWQKDQALIHKIFSAGQGLAATFTASAGVIQDSVVVTDGGSGYSDGDTIVIDGDAGGNADATFTVTVEDGVVTAITVTAGGTGYTTGSIVVSASVAPTDSSVIFPDYDYSTFE